MRKTENTETTDSKDAISTDTKIPPKQQTNTNIKPQSIGTRFPPVNHPRWPVLGHSGVEKHSQLMQHNPSMLMTAPHCVAMNGQSTGIQINPMVHLQNQNQQKVPIQNMPLQPM